MLQRYKKAERIAFKRVSATMASWLGRVASAWKRFVDGGRQGVSILVVAHTEELPRGIRISFFGLAGASLSLIVVFALVIAFSGSLGGVKAKVSASSAELLQAQDELNALRDQAARLSRAYEDFQAALSPIMSTGAARESGVDAKRVSLPSFFARRSSEAQTLAEIRASLDQSAPVVSEYGSMLGKMDAVKSTVPAVWPIGGDIGHISTTFGTNPNPFTGQSYFHNGIDCSTYRSGDLIIATAAGKVVFSGIEGGYGRCVIIAHAYGYMTRYGHMDRLLVHSGQSVKQGQSIGILGNTGVSTAPHTHYEVIMGRRYLDPTDYLWEGARSHPIITGGGYGD